MKKAVVVVVAVQALAFAVIGAEAPSPYGICAHVTRSLRGEHML